MDEPGNTDPLSGNAQWVEDCMKWRGTVLRGEFSHWCPEWDGLPVDETSLEFPCGCYD